MEVLVFVLILQKQVGYRFVSINKRFGTKKSISSYVL
jgi:hypothetical protein